MSLINQVLQDLEKRHAADPETRNLPPQVRAVSAATTRRLPVIALLLGMVSAAALAGAAGEAMTNAAKHGNAGAVTLYVELDDDAVFVSVKDDGAGFDVEGAEAGIGMSQSITGRIEAVGGRVGWRSTAPHGAEVSLTVPLTDGRNQRRRGAEPR